MSNTHIYTPATPEELAATLRTAARQGEPIIPWGAGTRMHIGYPPPDEASHLSTTRLSRVLDHVAPDMTVTVEAGITLGALQQVLAAQQQWLPWDPPSAMTATLGGLLASGASGPLRLGYGTPRDWVLGMRTALGDGRLIKSGGKVVKNVAGYDTHKLQIGALGTLGVIAEVSFKVFPMPERDATLLWGCADSAAALKLASQLREPPLAPAALVLLDAGADSLAGVNLPEGAQIVAARFLGLPAAVERLVASASTVANNAPQMVETEAAAALWQQIANRTMPDETCLLVRAAASPSALGGVLEAMHACRMPNGQAPETWGLGGVGVAYGRWALPLDAPLQGVAAALQTLRASLASHGGYAVVEAAPATLRSQLDLWGPAPDTLPLMRAIRKQWDPVGILNRGRYLRGLE